MKLHIKTVLLILIVIFMIYPLYTRTDAYEGATGNIRVGLFFDDPSRGIKKAVFALSLDSGNGMEIAHIEQNNFVVLAECAPCEGVTVRKDTWHIKDGDQYTEYTPERVPSSGDKKGPFHIRIGSVYGNRENADKIVGVLRSKAIDSYPVYDGRWSVWAGHYPDEETAKKALPGIEKNADGHECSVIHNRQMGVAVIGAKGNTLLMYIQKSGILGFIPKEKSGGVSLINVNGKPYRGRIEIYRLPGSDMTVVNDLMLDEYLYGVVPCEMNAGSHPEALKAQAVASRTYAVKNLGKYKTLAFDLSDGPTCQVYRGYSAEYPSTNKAVDATAAEIVTYNGSPAATYYFSSSGGVTENVANVWGGSGFPYLVSVEDKYEKGNSTNYNWEAIYTAEQIRNELKAASRDPGEITSIKISRFSETGRVIELSVTGTRGNEVFTNSGCRDVLDSLCSQMYTISTDADVFVMDGTGKAVMTTLYGKEVVSPAGTQRIKSKTVSIIGPGGKSRTIPTVPTVYTFRGKGWGHAVGMSQEGAKGMAEAGFDYKEILMHYYPGTNVE